MKFSFLLFEALWPHCQQRPDWRELNLSFNLNYFCIFFSISHHPCYSLLIWTLRTPICVKHERRKSVQFSFASPRPVFICIHSAGLNSAGCGACNTPKSLVNATPSNAETQFIMRCWRRDGKMKSHIDSTRGPFLAAPSFCRLGYCATSVGAGEDSVRLIAPHLAPLMQEPL